MQNKKRRLLRALIITALPVEYRAVRDYLTDIREEIHPEGTIYETGQFLSEQVLWQVGVVEAGTGGVRTALETERALRYFQPRILLFVGIAGGLKDMKIGDVVAATKVYAYEGGKVSAAFAARPDIGLSTYGMEQRARVVARQQTWQNRIKSAPSLYQPQAFVAPIAAGEKVLASTESKVYTFLKSHFNDALAVEMESHGFLAVARANQQVDALVVRGISNLLNNKHATEGAGTQKIASHHASAFAFELLASLGMDQSFQDTASTVRAQDVQPESHTSLENVYNTKIYGETTLVQGNRTHITINHQRTREDSPVEKGAPNVVFSDGYALIVGISSYADTRLKLSTAPLKDAMDMHTLLRKAEYCGYQDEHVKPLINHEATAENIRKKLKWLAEVTKANEKATAIFYFSGHGGRIEIDGQVSHYLLPFDCDLDNLDSTAITSTQLVQLLQAIRPPRLLVLLDNCYAGGIDEIKGIAKEQGILKYGSEEDYYHQLAQGQGRVIIASSGSDEISRSWSTLNNSLFTHYLLEALRGAANSLGDGLIRVNELFSYVNTQVLKDRSQHPVMTAHDTENFPIALYRGGKQERISSQQSVSERKRELAGEINHTSLRNAIVRAFTLEELELLCVDIRQVLRGYGVDEPLNLDMLPGAPLPVKAQSLIDYCERRGWLRYLIDEIARTRPNLTF